MSCTIRTAPTGPNVLRCQRRPFFGGQEVPRIGWKAGERDAVRLDERAERLVGGDDRRMPSVVQSPGQPGVGSDVTTRPRCRDDNPHGRQCAIRLAYETQSLLRAAAGSLASVAMDGMTQTETAPAPFEVDPSTVTVGARPLSFEDVVAV